MTKEITIKWNEAMHIDLFMPKEDIPIAELIGVLEMCKLGLYETKPFNIKQDD